MDSLFQPTVLFHSARLRASGFKALKGVKFRVSWKKTVQG